MRYATWLLVLVIFAQAMGSGCGPAVRMVTVETAADIEPRADVATIIVVQPMIHGIGTPFINLVDQDGQLVGQIPGLAHTAVRVAPGPFRLYAIPERSTRGADRIEGTVEAGRTYYASIGRSQNAGVLFLALNPRTAEDRWAERDAYLERAPHVEMDREQLPLAVTELGDTAPLLAAIDERIDQLDAAHREERTILASDGL